MSPGAGAPGRWVATLKQSSSQIGNVDGLMFFAAGVRESGSPAVVAPAPTLGQERLFRPYAEGVGD